MDQRRRLIIIGGIRRAALILALLVTLGIWLLGCVRYTSLGVDTAWLDEGVSHTRYYRVRWPGDGSLWIGGGSFIQPPGQEPVERFDLAAAWLQPSRPPAPQSIWNRLGFWWVRCPDEGWLGVPGWLLPIGLSGFALRRWRRHEQQHSSR